MVKFDYAAFGVSARANAETEGTNLRTFLREFDEVMGRISPTEKCVKPSDLYLKKPLKNSSLLKHILSCNYCRRFVKLMWLAYTSDQEQAMLLEIMYGHEPLPKNLTSHIKSLFEERPVLPNKDCYIVPHLLTFNQLRRELKKHRDTCERCSIIIDFFQKMPLPSLS